MKKQQYTYILLRYIHDVVRDEAFNVGVLVCSLENNFVGFRSRTNLTELKKVFPDFEAAKLKSYLASLENIFESKHKELSLELPLDKPKSITALAFDVVQPDGGSIQWGRIGSGISDNLCNELDDLSQRFVQVSLASSNRHTRSDDAVWSRFSKVLKKRGLLACFKPHVITVGGIEQTYDYTYQNGKLHCLQPLSLDLSNEENIMDKVYKEAGKLHMIQKQEGAPKLKVYYLLGAPRKAELKTNFEQVRSLMAMNGDVSVFTEDEAEMLPDVLESIVHRDCCC